ncbi:MAG TPA: hypothetical protein VFV83_09775 [Chthoniobacteraceae bacterium]|nr:hypothetical protein [Chthoniobacteraceae bacterium]
MNDMNASRLKLLLRVLGGICVSAVVPLFVPRSWLDAGHRFLGLGEFSKAPIAEYLARSVSALCAFYGGLLLLLAGDLGRYISIIKYQAVAIMILSLIGIFAGVRAGVPAYLVIGDALGCWVFLLPILVLATRFDPERP